MLSSTSTNASGEFEIETELGWHGYVSNKFPIPLRMVDSKETGFWLRVSTNDVQSIEKQLGPIIIRAITDEVPITIDVGEIDFTVQGKKKSQ
ncbi:MAG: hypothetical protein KC964_22565 [Candidatus Omnitrophica bacterium]|nr:hypothetical protein [Candidatus Omnitrophota bacterium]